MSTHTAIVSWERGDQDFSDARYSRAHRWNFDGGVEVRASSSPKVVPAPMSTEDAVDPEEAFVAALASCHMLWFLVVAAKKGFVVDDYHDEAEGLMAKNDIGRQAMTRICLKPKVNFRGQEPDASQLQALHHEAHERCYIANSVKTVVACEPR